MKFYPTMNTVFDDLFYDPFMSRSSNNMRTDIIEKENEYELSMELPGFNKEDIRMELKDGYLMISANKNTDNEVKDDKGHVIRRERYQGNCSRSFYVGDVKEEDIKASFTNGELKVSLPKSNVKHAEEKKYIEIQ
ncbi:Hsp20/alpha crystallin family protein [uncultured Traorella sp.]|uniref:Hsp20/alpha crystallin family protein n=1 Tax=uncultured Traorella sp. TaxID=1929048 RepID=UPI0025D3EAED|nr:Hsp20/alpha crystallin family protein [uncultured Traorella sp.]